MSLFLLGYLACSVTIAGVIFLCKLLAKDNDKIERESAVYERRLPYEMPREHVTKDTVILVTPNYKPKPPAPYDASLERLKFLKSRIDQKTAQKNTDLAIKQLKNIMGPSNDSI